MQLHQNNLKCFLILKMNYLSKSTISNKINKGVICISPNSNHTTCIILSIYLMNTSQKSKLRILHRLTLFFPIYILFSLRNSENVFLFLFLLFDSNTFFPANETGRPISVISLIELVNKSQIPKSVYLSYSEM